MKKLSKVIYPIRMILFISHLLMLYMMIDDIVYVSFGYLFLIIDTIYVIRVIIELFSQKSLYKKDIYYNIMQIGLYTYIGVLSYRLTFANVWGKALLLYLKTNYIILSILFLFLIFYSVYLINKMNDK